MSCCHDEKVRGGEKWGGSGLHHGDKRGRWPNTSLQHQGQGDTCVVQAKRGHEDSLFDAETVYNREVDIKDNGSPNSHCRSRKA